MSRSTFAAALALSALLARGALADSTAAEHPVRITVLVSAPPSTPAGATLWLAGNAPELGAWNPAGLKLAPGVSGAHAASLVVAAGTSLEFKVTRGSWETVEKGPSGEEIANRLHVAARDDTLRVSVATWRDQTSAGEPKKRSTRTGDIRTHAAFPSRFVRARDVLVWLPPGYEALGKQRYPVLYFHDGQNVFDDSTSFAGEWRLDETAARLIASGSVPPFIAVAVANSPERIAEYTSVADARHGGGRAAEYGRFLGEELKPFIDRTYRTKTGPATTGLVGSSLGGLVSLALACDRPREFGLVGAVSPSAGWGGRDLAKRAARATRELRVWLDIGTAEVASPSEASRMVDDVRAVRDALLAAGVPAARVRFEVIPGGRHHESDWAARLDRILEFLLAGLR